MSHDDTKLSTLLEHVKDATEGICDEATLVRAGDLNTCADPDEENERWIDIEIADWASASLPEVYRVELSYYSGSAAVIHLKLCDVDVHFDSKVGTADLDRAIEALMTARSVIERLRGAKGAAPIGIRHETRAALEEIAKATGHWDADDMVTQLLEEHVAKHAAKAKKVKKAA